MSNSPEQRKLAAIMFTDMVGYGALSQRDEALALNLLAEHRILLRGIFLRHEGREIKTTGDGFLLEFPSALAAVRAAVEMQQALHERNESCAAERRVRVRIGIHVGDVVMSDGDIYGDGVNIAARLEPLAASGGICISEDVARPVRNKLSFPVVPLGPADLKNIELPMQVYRVALPWEEAIPTNSAGTSARSAARVRWTTAIVLGLVTVFSVLALWRPWRATTRETANASAIAESAKSVAVLPFVNMSADKNDEYLSDGMTEELLNVLAKVKGLRVPGRTSSFAFKGRTEDGIFRKVGEELQVKTVLEGSVRKAGDKLRITAQLINVADGYHLWSETYDADMKDILAVQSDVAQRVVRALQVQLGIEEARTLAQTPTQNPEAYRLYLLGRYHFAKFTREGWAAAIRSFEQALQIDPTFVLAYCGLADTYGWCGGQILPGREAWAKEKDLALKALALDPKLAEAHLSLATALFSSRDYAGSVQSLDRALALDPNLALAYDQYGWTLLSMGRPDESVEKERKALELDPLNSLLNTDLGLFLQMARRYDEAVVELRKTLELDASNALAHVQLAWCLHWKGQTADALAEFKKATTLDDLPWYVGSLGFAYAAVGDQANAEQILRDLDELAKTRYVSPAARASVYLGLGEKGKALDWLEKALEDEDPMLWWYKSDQLYDTVRNEPRFQAIAKRAERQP
jgi:adenylate cyclase